MEYVRKYNSYYINHRIVNIEELDKYYHSNMEMVCRHIENNCLVDRKTSSYYVNLYIQDKPFKKKWSVLSVLSLCFSLPLLIAFPIILGIPLIIVSLILAIVDLVAIKRTELIPRSHGASIAAIVICVMAIIATIYTLSKPDEDTITKTDSKAVVSSEVKTSETNKKAKKEAETAPQKVKVNVGKGMIYKKNVIIDFTNFYEIADYGYFPPKDGYKIVAFDLKITNNSDGDFYFSAYNANGYADNTQVEEYYLDGNLSLDLSSGRTGNITIAFEVPENAQSIEMDYEFNQFTEDSVIFIGQ